MLELSILDRHAEFLHQIPYYVRAASVTVRQQLLDLTAPDHIIHYTGPPGVGKTADVFLFVQSIFADPETRAYVCATLHKEVKHIGWLALLPRGAPALLNIYSDRMELVERVQPLEVIAEFVGDILVIDGSNKKTEFVSSALFDWVKGGSGRAAMEVASSPLKVLGVDFTHTARVQIRDIHPQIWSLEDYFNVIGAAGAAAASAGGGGAAAAATAAAAVAALVAAFKLDAPSANYAGQQQTLQQLIEE